MECSDESELFRATITHHRMPPNTPPVKWLIFGGHLANNKPELWVHLGPRMMVL